MNASDVVIRKAAEADADAVARLSGQLGYPVARSEIPARLRDAEADAARMIVVAVRGVEVVGWMDVQRRSALESGAWGEIVGLVVDEACRGSGVGTMLVAWAKEWTRASGLARLRVRTNAERRDAAAFYEARGFVLKKMHGVYDVGV